MHRTDCPICASVALRDIGQLSHRHLVACRSCNHEFVDRYDDECLAAEYRTAYYSDVSDPRIDAWAAAHHSVWDAIVAQLVSMHPAADSFLDIGSGSGGFLERIRTRCPNARLAGVEPAAAARVAVSTRMPDVTFVAESADSLAQVEDRFDVVTMLQTLEHLNDPLGAVRGALRCLHPDGVLFVTVPNRKSIRVLRHGKKSDCYANGTHLQFFDSRHLSQLLIAAGYHDIRRVVGYGGGQHARAIPKLAQYALRRSGLSTELRFTARRRAAGLGARART